MGEICIACKVTEGNFEWLAEITHAETINLRSTMTKPMLTVALDFGQGNIAEVGDYIIAGGSNIFRPLEAEIFEDNYEKL